MIPPSSLCLNSHPHRAGQSNERAVPVGCRRSVGRSPLCILTLAAGVRPAPPLTWPVSPASPPNSTLLRLSKPECPQVPSCMATNTFYPNPLEALTTSGSRACSDILFSLVFCVLSAPPVLRSQGSARVEVFLWPPFQSMERPCSVL